MNQVAATIRPTMQLTQRIRNLALAVAASVAILAIPATQAHATPEQPNLCVQTYTGGHVEFVVPGTKATDAYGNKWFCGADGKWYQDYSSIALPTATPTRSSTLLAPQGSTLAR